MHRLLRFSSIHATLLVAFVFQPPSSEARLVQRLLPGGNLAPVIRADPREPAVGAKLLGVLEAVSRFGTGIEGEAAVGYSLPFLLLSGESPDHATVLGLQGGVFGRFLMETAARELISTDWVFAIPLIIWRGGNWYRFRYRHFSSHLGDEYIEVFNAERSDFSRDAIEVTAYRKLTSGFSAYAGGDVAFNVQPTGSKRLRLVGGIEFADVANEGPEQFFGGINVSLYQDASWRPQVNIQTGVMLFPENERRLRFLLGVVFGPSIQGEFHRDDETVVMLGFLLEL